MGKVMVIAEHHKGKLSSSTKAVIGAASKLSSGCDVLVACDKDTLSKEVQHCQGVDSVLMLTHPRFEHILAEDLAPIISQCAKDYTHILAPATTFGKNLLPRVAALLDVAQVSDVMEIVSKDTFTHPIYAGNALETVQSMDPIKVLTIRPTAFEEVGEKSEASQIVELALDVAPFSRVTFKSLDAPTQTRPELTDANIVVSGGRGLKNAENFKLIETLADKLGAAIGATRAAVDAGFVPNDFQVGQTGKVVAPSLYIAIGISGAVQHLAGMKESKVIVAINQDSDAPIFQVADYGIVGDLFTLVPELTDML